MAIKTEPKVAYIYNGTDWYPVAGTINRAENFAWTGAHSFSQSTTFSNSIIARRGVNNFASTSERTASIPSPTNGIITTVTTSGITYPQYYGAGDWRLFSSNAFVETRTSADFVSGTLTYRLRSSDIGKTILMNHSAAHSVTIRTNANTPLPIGSQVAIVSIGSGQVEIIPETSAVIINSKFNNKKLSTQYSQAVLVKTGTDTWLLMGDLTA